MVLYSFAFFANCILAISFLRLQTQDEHEAVAPDRAVSVRTHHSFRATLAPQVLERVLGGAGCGTSGGCSTSDTVPLGLLGNADAQKTILLIYARRGVWECNDNCFGVTRERIMSCRDCKFHEGTASAF